MKNAAPLERQEMLQRSYGVGCSDLGLNVVIPLGHKRLIEYGITKFDSAGQGYFDFVPICDYTVQENATPRLGGVRNAGVLLSGTCELVRDRIP